MITLQTTRTTTDISKRSELLLPGMILIVSFSNTYINWYSFAGYVYHACCGDRCAKYVQFCAYDNVVSVNRTLRNCVYSFDMKQFDTGVIFVQKIGEEFTFNITRHIDQCLIAMTDKTVHSFSHVICKCCCDVAEKYLCDNCEIVKSKLVTCYYILRNHNADLSWLFCYTLAITSFNNPIIKKIKGNQIAVTKDNKIEDENKKQQNKK